MDTFKALAILRRRWPILAITIVGSLLIGIAAVMMQREAYQASALLWLSASRMGGVYVPVGDLDALAQTYARLANRQPTLEQAIRDSGITISPEQLAGMVSARVVPRALVEVSVTAPDPVQAVELTNAIANAMTTSDQVINSTHFARGRSALEAEIAAVEREISRIQQDLEPLRIMEREGRLTPSDREALDRLEVQLARQRASQTALLGSLEDLRLAEAGGATPISVVEPAIEAYSTRSTTRTAMLLILPLLGGIAVGLALAFGVDYFDDRLRDEQTAPSRTHLPVLGTVPTAKDRIDPATHPAYRRLASHVVAALPPHAHSLVVIGSQPELAGDVANRLQAALASMRPADGVRVIASGGPTAIPFVVEPSTPVLIAGNSTSLTARQAESIAEEVERLAGITLGVVLTSRSASRLPAPTIQHFDHSEPLSTPSITAGDTAAMNGTRVAEGRSTGARA